MSHWVWLVLCSSLVVACLPESGPAQREPDSCECADGKPVVDPALLAFLSRARAAHGQADIAERDGKREVAIGALVELVKARRPAGELSPVEVREVLADTFARLAELRSALGQFDAAVADIESGLKLAVETTYYRGRLKEVLGLVEKRRYLKLLADGDETAAKKAKDRAIKASQDAIAIQDAVIAKAFPDAGLPLLKP